MEQGEGVGGKEERAYKYYSAQSTPLYLDYRRPDGYRPPRFGSYR